MLLKLATDLVRPVFNHANIQYSDKMDSVGVVVDGSRFESVGFRNYSAVRRDHLNTKIEFETDRGKATLIANYVDNQLSQEPGSRTGVQYAIDPYGAKALNVKGKYSKSYTQGIYGLTFDGKISTDTTYGYRVYAGERNLDNPSATYFLIDRAIYGAAYTLTSKSTLASIPVKSTFGVDYDYVKDIKRGYSNSNGNLGGMKSYQDNLASSYGTYMQSELFFSEKYTGLVGLRVSRVNLKIIDRDGGFNSSGSKEYSGISPVLGLTYHLS